MSNQGNAGFARLVYMSYSWPNGWIKYAEIFPRWNFFPNIFVNLRATPVTSASLYSDCMAAWVWIF